MALTHQAAHCHHLERQVGGPDGMSLCDPVLAALCGHWVEVHQVHLVGASLALHACLTGASHASTPMCTIYFPCHSTEKEALSLYREGGGRIFPGGVSSNACCDDMM